MFLNNGIVQYLPVSCRPDIVLRGLGFFVVFFMFFFGIFYGFLAFDCKKPAKITRIGLT